MNGVSLLLCGSSVEYDLFRKGLGSVMKKGAFLLSSEPMFELDGRFSGKVLGD
jgi:hypothetical protein